jgi:hypothetical protein
MKKLLATLLLTASVSVFADTTTMNMSSVSQPSNQIDIAKTMYFDFGLGVGGASGWSSGGTTAINAMTMGTYFSNNLGAEVGMDVLPDGSNSSGQAMIMTYHLAAKGVLPLSNVFSLYGKAGLGINQYEGEAPTNTMGMSMANQASFGLYYAGGMQFNFNKNFGIYLEGSGVAVPNLGNNGNSNAGAFGSTYMGTLGLEVRI